MLNITNLSLLKITKVRPWSICFDYDGVHYLLKGKSELGEGDWQDLYERELDHNGKYILNKLGCCEFAPERVDVDYVKKQKGRTLVYSQIDKAFFAYKLTKRGFATGVMENKIKEVAERIAEVDVEIKKHEEAIAQLRQQRRDIESLKETKVENKNVKS
ncbi:MAG: hypothetical protein UGF89_05450 [Acutalibacteraceae bacterium]|nr:hypothetical protein [Acutalibacteraceae bacterium]